MLRLLISLSFLFVSCSKKDHSDSEGSQKIDASSLKISKIEAKLSTDPKRKVTFALRKHPAAMYSQFIICTVTKPVRCNPSEKAPGIARTDDYEFLTPPHGDLEIKVRACVEAPYAKNKDQLCGSWKRASVGTQAYR